MCFSNPSRSKSISNRYSPQIKQFDFQSYSVASPFSLNSPNLSMMVPENISKITFCAKRIYMIQAITLKFKVILTKSVVLVARNPEPAFKLWSTNISKHRKRLVQVVPQPTSSVKEAEQMRIEKTQLKTMRSPAVTIRLNQVYSIARTIVLPSSMSLMIQIKRKPANKGWRMVSMENKMQYRSKKEAEKVRLMTKTIELYSISPYSQSCSLYLYQKSLSRKGTFLRIKLVSSKIPQHRLTREQINRKVPMGFIGVRQAANYSEKLVEGVYISSMRYPNTMITLMHHTKKYIFSSFLTNLTTFPKIEDFLSISIKQSSSPCKKSYVSFQNDIKLLIFSS